MDISFIILFVICLTINLLLAFVSYRERCFPSESEKKKFGHKPRMKFISKLTCGQVIARLWVDSYSPLDCQFGKDEDDNYTFTINGIVYWKNIPGRAKYKVLVMPEQEGSAVYFIIVDYQARKYMLDEFAWELKGVLEKKLEAVRIE